MNHDDERTRDSELPADDAASDGNPGPPVGSGTDPDRHAARHGSDRSHPDSSELATFSSGSEAHPEAELVPPDLADMIARIAVEQVEQSLAIESHSSGPLPTAPDLALYTSEHQERILRMAESISTDESVRRDRIIDAGIRTTSLATWSRNGMFGLSLGLAFLSYAFWENVLMSALFVSLPVLQVVGTTIHSSISERDQPKKDD